MMFIYSCTEKKIVILVKNIGLSSNLIIPFLVKLLKCYKRLEIYLWCDYYCLIFSTEQKCCQSQRNKIYLQVEKYNTASTGLLCLNDIIRSRFR